MIKTARQLKDLIRNLSREKSADAQILMRNYMMERLTMKLVGEDNVRETTLYPRDLSRLEP